MSTPDGAAPDSESPPQVILGTGIAAGGGWVAPSETIYSLPGVAITRGGISFTQQDVGEWQEPPTWTDRRWVRALIVTYLLAAVAMFWTMMLLAASEDHASTATRGVAAALVVWIGVPWAIYCTRTAWRYIQRGSW